MRKAAVDTPVEHRIVLVGAGNAHLSFVQLWKMRPIPGVAVTLVSDYSSVAYWAMVPGQIAGEYDHDDVFIDLVQLCTSAGVRLLAEPVLALEPAGRRLHFAARPSLGYDVVSLGLGSVPTPPPGTIEGKWSLRMRPLGELVRHLDELHRDLKGRPRPFRFAVVGGGPSGCELALAIDKRFSLFPGFETILLHGSSQLLPRFRRRAARLIERTMRERGIDVHLDARVVKAEEGMLVVDDGRRFEIGAVLWATNPLPPPLLGGSGLLRDGSGFLLVRETLQSVADPTVFGTGDCVAFEVYPSLPKNGVQAVRQGRLLFDNIIAFIQNRHLHTFRPRRRWLSLMNTADGSAIASFGPFVRSGRWARHLKNRIDRRWMRKFVILTQVTSEPASSRMRCGGCGSKVAGDVLTEALQRLDVLDHPRILVGCRDADDAAVFRTGSSLCGNEVEVQTVDYFTAFVDDPFLFGRIAALHGLSDLYAMNARPFIALAIATVPYARGRVQADQLAELLAGAAGTFRELGVTLAGGHTTEGAELALGFSVTGHAVEENLFRKGGLRPGDQLILTKPLGTGALLAARMRGACRAESYEGAIRSMLQANRDAAESFAAAGVRACTDVTGFGLAGHLLEMLDAGSVSARLNRASIPVLHGFAEVVANGIVSSLQEGNARVTCRIEGPKPLPSWLFDPQTSGGLLAGVRSELAAAVVAQLRSTGLEAASIGEVVKGDGQTPTIEIE